MEAGIRYSRHDSDALTPEKQDQMLQIPYKQALGSLQYLVTYTRWDIAFAVNHLAHFMQNPAPIHWLGVKRIFRYLNGSRSQGLIYSSITHSDITPHQLHGWSDADWAGNPDTRWSTSSYIFQIDSLVAKSQEVYSSSLFQRG